MDNTLIKLIGNIFIRYLIQILLMIINCLPRVNFSVNPPVDKRDSEGAECEDFVDVNIGNVGADAVHGDTDNIV